MRIGVLTGGGDAPGLNAAIRAVARRALAEGDTVLGVPNGWAGMVGEGTLIEIGRRNVSGILQLGGTMLGSSRTNPLKMEGGLERVSATMAGAGIDALVAIGGDDTLSVAARLAEAGSPVVGVPKTMDNDLSVTEYCIGFDSAVGIVTEALDRLHTTAASHHRVMVVEVMGRDTGWVAVMGGLAGGADMIIIPEFAVSLDEVVDHLHARRAAGSDFSIIVASEGVRMPEMGQDEDPDGPKDAFGHVLLSRRGVGERLAALIEQRTHLETRATVLGHTQRGGSPSAYDRIWATHVGAAAYDLVRARQWGMMPVVQCGAVRTAAIAEVVAEQRRVPRELYELAKTFY
ncbi:MAG TPA: ATP-dependent 6-phosphofructokinase [Candidatus Dormibacteraeota bacterium]|jgi:6-phosphofructokinase 1|nr:ATP-dependent 6-phosphofructokinase [Candidatus Dormibacteraeota bacterium]